MQIRPDNDGLRFGDRPRLVASTAIGAVVVSTVVRRRCFTSAQQLILH
ncbi:MAG: hypothetical protein O2782_00520 [bacterium]|nr:hypothetical protein [bacterium]